jgi:hypothetical protein
MARVYVSSTIADLTEERRAVLDLWVPRTSSTSCDQAIFVDHATDSRAPSDTVLLKVDGFG